MIPSMNLLLLCSLVIASDEKKSDTVERSFWLISDQKIAKCKISGSEESTHKIDFTEDTHSFENLKKFEHQKGFVMPLIYETKILTKKNTKTDSLTIDFYDKDEKLLFRAIQEFSDKNNGDYTLVITGENDEIIHYGFNVLHTQGSPISTIIVGSEKEISHKLGQIVNYANILWINDTFLFKSGTNDIDLISIMRKFIYNNEISKFDKKLSLCLNETMNIVMSLFEYTRICIKDLLLEEESYEEDRELTLVIKRNVYNEAVNKFMSGFIDQKSKTKKESKKRNTMDNLDWLLAELNQMVAAKQKEEKYEPTDMATLKIDEDSVKKITISNLKEAILLFSELSLKAHCKKVLNLNDSYFKLLYKDIVNFQESSTSEEGLYENGKNAFYDPQRIPESVDDLEEYDISEKNYFKLLLFTFNSNKETIIKKLKNIRDNEIASKLTIGTIIYRLQDIKKGLNNNISIIEYLKKYSVKKYDKSLLSFLIFEFKKDLEKCEAALEEFEDKKVHLEDKGIKSLNDLINNLAPKADTDYTSPTNDSGFAFNYDSNSKKQRTKKKPKGSGIYLIIMIIILVLIIFYFIKKA